MHRMSGCRVLFCEWMRKGERKLKYGKELDKIGKQISSELSQDKNAERNGVTEPKRKRMKNNETEKDFVRHYIAGGMYVL